MSGFTDEQDAAIRAYLLQPRDDSRAAVEAYDRAYAAFARPNDLGTRGDDRIRREVQKAAVYAAQSLGYPHNWSGMRPVSEWGGKRWHGRGRRR